MSTESSSATLRECPNRECKSTHVQCEAVGSHKAAMVCIACGVHGPPVDYQDQGVCMEVLIGVRAEAARLWNALPRDGDAKRFFKVWVGSRGTSVCSEFQGYEETKAFALEKIHAGFSVEVHEHKMTSRVFRLAGELEEPRG